MWADGHGGSFTIMLVLIFMKIKIVNIPEIHACMTSGHTPGLDDHGPVATRSPRDSFLHTEELAPAGKGLGSPGYPASTPKVIGEQAADYTSDISSPTERVRDLVGESDEAYWLS